MAIIESVTMHKCLNFLIHELQSKLWTLLHKRRFLIVLDEVWNEDQDEGDKLEPLFRGGMGGSKVIITIRSKKVAFFMSSPSCPYYLEGLAEEDCWKLFEHRAFQQGEEHYQNLLPIGKEIIKKCGGLPLAAKTLGSLMRFKRGEKEWLFVQNNELWNLGVCGTGVLPALRLSYLHLPSHLKHCFTFCSTFPKRYEIQKEKVIRMWMAAGLIQSDGASKPPEDTGEAGKNDIRRYRMHDIVHDLAQSQEKNSHITVRSQALAYPHIVSTRVLGYGTTEKLPFLQTLNLCGCYNLQELPFIANMISLRHLNITGCEALTSMSHFFNGTYKRCGRFSSRRANHEEFIYSNFIPKPSNQLQTLSTVMVGGFLDLTFLGQLRTSGFAALILGNCELPYPNHGHVILAEPSWILFYRISSSEICCLVDVPAGQKLPSISNGEMVNYLKSVVAPQAFKVGLAY
ncbi:putative disease resistance protein RGA1 [Ricinus communis]|uniref:putative disease resistance protein RGA1 n=1 Tax=Ricinus communis TaxID=3988 RepID=UPI00201A409E|nr:putative disease resistance protein RGA1 [Ricinus communis]